MERSRAWVFTWNNYDNAAFTLLNSLSCRFIVYGKEVAPTTNTPHLQGYVYFAHGKTNRTVRGILPGCHIERARGTTAQCIDYCKKDGDFVERGDPPLSPAAKGELERSRWNEAYRLASTGNLAEIDSRILVPHYGNLSRIAADNMARVESLPCTTGIWLIGASGSGKSRGCREKFPNLYPKPLNKWWDGYREQETVLIDDVDRSHVQWIGGFLKIWADHYAFIAESKGKSREIRPKRILVTSQYAISDLFAGERELIEALERRFFNIGVRIGEPIQWRNEDNEIDEEVVIVSDNE